MKRRVAVLAKGRNVGATTVHAVSGVCRIRICKVKVIEGLLLESFLPLISVMAGWRPRWIPQGAHGSDSSHRRARSVPARGLVKSVEVSMVQRGQHYRVE
jgi:hypothetical protein